MAQDFQNGRISKIKKIMKITIPEKSFESCNDCKFYHHKLRVSGRNPIYDNQCHHPKSRTGMVHISGRDLKLENGYPITPDWCPLKDEDRR